MKINIASSQHKKSFFPISIDSSTTANFGECLPVFASEVPPNTKVSYNIRNAIRFAPLSLPTFGKAFLKTYSFAHKISDLYPPFDDMLARTPYTSGSGKTYVPKSVPKIPLYYLWLMVLSNCEFTFHLTNWKNVKRANNGTDSFIISELPYTPAQVGYGNDTSWTPLDSKSAGASLPLFLAYALRSPNSDLSLIAPSFGSVDSLTNYLTTDTSIDKLFTNNKATNLGAFPTPKMYSSDGSFLGVSPENADYVFYLPNAIQFYLRYDENLKVLKASQTDIRFKTEPNGDEPSTIHNANEVMVCIRLTDAGKLLRKTLMGLGYQVAPLNTEVSILPLYAYFKSYFETFAPKRFVKFEQTYFSRLMNEVVTTGTNFVNCIQSSNANTYSVGFSNIVDDLLSCFYTKDTDYYTAQIVGLINEYGESISQKYLGVGSDETGAGITPKLDEISNFDYEGASNKDDQAFVNLSNKELFHTQAQQNILSRLTQFLNRRSVIGAKLEGLLKSVFGISVSSREDKSYIGSSSIDVDFSDVFSTAETSEGSLGEYAGKALASGYSDTFSYDTKSHTIILSFLTVTPRTQYVQGLFPYLTHVNADDFYNPMYDGLTLLPTRKSYFYTPAGVQLFGFDDDKSSFGNIPIYSEYKTKTSGILSGDLSLPSTRNSYDSFTLDEVISDINSYSDPQAVGHDLGFYKRIQLDPNAVVCGTMWRYLGRWLWLGRFDRIFVNNRINFDEFVSSLIPQFLDQFITSRNIARTDDNLVIHSIVDLKLNSAMVPLSGSFMTDDLLALDPNGVIVQGE